MTSNIRKMLGNSRLPIGLFAVLLALIAFGPVVRVAAGANETPSAGDAALFERLDANHDDKLAAEEIAAENRQLFDRLLRRSDADHDRALSRTEFVASLAPTRPAKPLEAKEPSTSPQANAVRYLLLSMDANRNGRIEKDEAPAELKGALDVMVERIDRNGNGNLEREELNRGGPAMLALAGRFVERLGVDVDAELAKLKKSEGDAFNRFEQPPVPLQELRDPKQARQLFAQFDENSDGKLDAKEVPPPLTEPIARMTRIADRDGDGKLDEEEFVGATQRISKILRRGGSDQMPRRESRPDRKPKPTDSAAANKR